MCRGEGDKVKRKELMREAVARGGNKLDAYDGLYGFYTKKECGFEPVSWCKWDDEFAPPDWKKANGFKDGDDSWKSKSNDELAVPREDIVFFRYTGKQHTESLEDFKKRVKASDDYDAAQSTRDKSLKQKGGKKK